MLYEFLDEQIEQIQLRSFESLLGSFEYFHNTPDSDLTDFFERPCKKVSIHFFFTKTLFLDDTSRNGVTCLHGF